MIKLKKRDLILFTGLIWLWAGILLLFRAYSWLPLLNGKEMLAGFFAAILIAFIKIKLIFKKLTEGNIKRISGIKDDKVSILKFHLPKDQIFIIIMIVGGSLLRKSNIVSKVYLMPVYAGIGSAMLYSAGLYVSYFLKSTEKIKKE